MNVVFLETAEFEFNEAIMFYNIQRENLGYEFASEVKNAIERIIENPEAWAPLSKRTRRCLTRRFPYGIIYQIRNKTLLIISVMHLRRKPQTWRSRMPKAIQ